MEDQTKKVTLATAAIGGYVLGRTKKGRLALTVATVVAGRGLGSNARELATQGVRRLGKMPQAAELKTHVREQGVQAARGALSAVADRGMGSLADAISGRTAALSQKGGTGEGEEEEEGEEGEEEEEEEEESRNEEDEDSEPENESESEEGEEEGDAEDEGDGEEEKPPTAERRRSARASGRSSERHGARTAPTKKAPAKKKVPAKKTAAKRTESSRSSRGR